MKKLLVTAMFMAASSMAFAQTPAPDSPGQPPLPICSTEDAAKVRQGATPSTPCRLPPDNAGQPGTPSAPPATPAP